MFCTECGKESSGESEFCIYCGKALPPPPPDVSQAAPPGPPAAAPPPQPGGITPPAPPVGQPAVPPVQPGQQAGPSKKSPSPWILGGVGVAVGIAVVLVLVLVVFGGGADTSGPEKVVETFFEALEKQDVDMFLGTMEPSYRSNVKDVLGEECKKYIEDNFFTLVDLEVTIRKMDTEIDGDKATVTVVDGTSTHTDEDGEKVTVEASETDMDTMDLAKVDGKWYVSTDTFVKAGLDAGELRRKEEYDALIYPGATLGEDASSVIEVEKLGISGKAYYTSDPVDKVIAWYKDELSGKPNFHSSISDTEGEMGVFSFGAMYLPIKVGVMEEEGRTLIVIDPNWE